MKVLKDKNVVFRKVNFTPMGEKIIKQYMDQQDMHVNMQNDKDIDNVGTKSTLLVKKMFMMLFVLMVLMFLPFTRAEVCDTTPTAVSKISECVGDTCVGNVHSNIVVSLGKRDFTCYTTTLGDTNIIEKIRIRISDVDIRTKVKYLYTSGKYDVTTGNINCLCPGSLGNIGEVRCGVESDACIGDIRKISRKAEGPFIGTGVYCRLSGDNMVLSSLGIKFSPGYHVYELGGWETNIIIQESTSINDTMVDYNTITWTGEEKSMEFKGNDLSIKSIVTEKLKLPPIQSKYLLVDAVRPWLKYFIDSTQVNRLGHYDPEKFGFIQGISGVYKTDVDVLKRYYTVKVNHCGHSIITPYLHLPDVGFGVLVDKYLGQHTTLFLNGVQYINDINQNKHLYGAHSNDIIDLSVMNKHNYIQYENPESGMFSLLEVNTTVKKNDCGVSVSNMGITKLVKKFDFVTCYYDNGDWFFKENELDFIHTVSNNGTHELTTCTIRQLDHLVAYHDKSNGCVAVKVTNGNATNACKNVCFNQQSELDSEFKIEANIDNYYHSHIGYMDMHYRKETNWLLDIVSKYRLKFVSKGKIRPVVSRCYIDKTKHILHMVVKNKESISGDVFVISNTSGLIQSGYHTIDSHFTDIKIPIIKHWENNNVLFSACFKNDCDTCKLFVDEYDDIVDLTAKTFEDKLMDVIAESTIGSMYVNFKTKSWLTWLLVVVITILVLCFLLGIILAICVMIWGYIKVYLKYLNIILYPLIFLFRCLCCCSLKYNMKTIRNMKKNKNNVPKKKIVYSKRNIKKKKKVQ